MILPSSTLVVVRGPLGLLKLLSTQVHSFFLSNTKSILPLLRFLLPLIDYFIQPYDVLLLLRLYLLGIYLDICGQKAAECQLNT